MKIIDIALKDLLRSLRSMFLIGMIRLPLRSPTVASARSMTMRPKVSLVSSMPSIGSVRNFDSHL